MLSFPSDEQFHFACLFVCFVGVKALENGLVISSSVDQRLALWEVVRKDQV